MLAADKLLLQSNLRQNAIKLKEKEFSLHHENFSSVGTQAAVLAGFTVTALIEFQVPPHTSRLLQLVYYTCVMLSLGFNLNCVCATTALSVFGTGLALRGPDGSMMRAVDGMYEERRSVFVSFAFGLVFTLFSAIFASWICMEPEAAFSCTTVVVVFMHRITTQFRRIFSKFSFPEEDGVSFDDILSTPLANVFHPHRHRERDRTNSDDALLNGSGPQMV